MTQNLGEKIRQARREKGMTQDQLAQALFVSRQTVSNWENGRTEPDYQTLTRLSELVGLEFLPQEETQTESEAEEEDQAQKPDEKKEVSPASVADDSGGGSSVCAGDYLSAVRRP